MKILKIVTLIVIITAFSLPAFAEETAMEHFEKGMELHEKGMEKEAIIEFEKALELDKDGKVYQLVFDSVLGEKARLKGKDHGHNDIHEHGSDEHMHNSGHGHSSLKVELAKIAGMFALAVITFLIIRKLTGGKKTGAEKE